MPEHSAASRRGGVVADEVKSNAGVSTKRVVSHAKFNADDDTPKIRTAALTAEAGCYRFRLTCFTGAVAGGAAGSPVSK